MPMNAMKVVQGYEGSYFVEILGESAAVVGRLGREASYVIDVLEDHRKNGETETEPAVLAGTDESTGPVSGTPDQPESTGPVSGAQAQAESTGPVSGTPDQAESTDKASGTPGQAESTGPVSGAQATAV